MSGINTDSGIEVRSNVGKAVGVIFASVCSSDKVFVSHEARKLWATAW